MSHVGSGDVRDLVQDMRISEYNLNRLQLIQNVACRIILRANNRTNVNGMHKELNLLYLKDRQYLHLSMECYKQINTNSGLNSMFTQTDHGRNTRGTSTKNMIVPRLLTSNGRKAFSYRGPLHWNTLPNKIKENDSKTSFKTCVSKLFARDENHPG